jgi:energy-converting hydrogenase Eha subunit C
MALDTVGELAICTAFKLLGYVLRVSHKKEFSNDPQVMAQREAFA